MEAGPEEEKKNKKEGMTHPYWYTPQKIIIGVNIRCISCPHSYCTLSHLRYLVILFPPPLFTSTFTLVLHLTTHPH